MNNNPFAPRDRLEEEFRPHYEAWKAAPSPHTADKLLKALDPVIQSSLRTFAGGSKSPTLKSRAKMIILDSLPRYDPKRAKLRTHLMVNLQSLHRAHAEENQIISVPERVRLHQHKLVMAENELRDKLGRDPSDMELSEHTGLSRKRIGHVRKAKLGYAEGQISSLPNEQGQTTGASVAVEQPDHSIWHEYIYHDLHPVDQVIMEHALGLHGKPVLPKGLIAQKLKLSPGAISQRAARIQALIDSREELAHNLF